MSKIKGRLVHKGGPGSGHHGHEGRPGSRGGSLPGGGGSVDGAGRYVVPSGAGTEDVKTIMQKANWQIASNAGSAGSVRSKVTNVDDNRKMFIEYAGNRTHYYVSEGGNYKRVAWESDTRRIPNKSDAVSWTKQGILGRPPEEHPEMSDFQQRAAFGDDYP